MKLIYNLALMMSLLATEIFAGSYGSSYSGSSSRNSSSSSTRSVVPPARYSPGTQTSGSSGKRSSPSTSSGYKSPGSKGGLPPMTDRPPMKMNSFEKPVSSAEAHNKKPLSDLTKPSERRKPVYKGEPYFQGSSNSPSIDERPTIQIQAPENQDNGAGVVTSTVRIKINSDGKQSEQVFVNGQLVSPSQEEKE